MYLWSWSFWGLTYVVFVVDDWVEGHVFSLQVSLNWLHIVGALVALNEALKFTIHNGAVSQGTFLTWESEEVSEDSHKIKYSCFRKT